MDTPTMIAMGLNFMIWTVGFILLIYLIIKRVKDKKAETFEDRDN
jgi:hypothetical protein